MAPVAWVTMLLPGAGARDKVAPGG